MCYSKPKHFIYPHPLLSHAFFKLFFFPKLKVLPTTLVEIPPSPISPCGLSYKDSIAQTSGEDWCKGNLKWIPSCYLAKPANLKATAQRTNALQPNKDKIKGIKFTP